MRVVIIGVHGIAKAERVLNYRPRYSSLQAVQESVSWLIEQGVITLDRETHV
jgi:hypothetical protein